MSYKCGFRSPGETIPQMDPIPLTSGESSAIWAERHAGNLFHVVYETRFVCSTPNIPQPYFAAPGGSESSAIGTER